ncbi:MAG: SPOR domain-containing protein [Myxococcota bacterium]|nr:SPOR domain-containing protein [Myxococcota bacterium]
MFFWFWLFSMSIAKADVMLRTGTLDSKEDAERLLSLSRRILKKEKLNIRRSRFLVPKQGYKYRVSIADIPSEQKALALAKRLNSIWLEVELVTEDAVQKKYLSAEEKFIRTVKPQESAPISEKGGAGAAALDEAEDRETVEEMDIRKDKKSLVSPQVTDILSFAEKALLPVTKKWENSETEKFVFYRILNVKNGDSLKAKHVFYRKGDAMKLELEVEEGQGEDSTTILTPTGKGMLMVNGENVERPSLRTKEVLNKFSSQQIFSILLNFSKDVNTDGPWRELHQVEKIKSNTLQAWRLFQDNDSKTGTILQAIFTQKEGWLLQIVVQDANGRLEYRLTEYTNLGGDLYLPFQMEKIRNGELEETVIVENLFLGNPLDDKIFSLDKIKTP